MKRKKFEKNRIVPACAFLAAAVSCEMVSPDRTAEVDREKIRVEVSIPQGATKMTSPGNEGLVNDFQVFVFREDGTLDAYTSGTGNTATVDCTSGPKDFVAVVNAPDLADVASRQELMSSRSMMADNSATAFVMAGSSVKDISEADPKVYIDVKRLAARVSVKKITNAMTAPAYSNAEIVLKRIFLANVAGDVPYSGTGTPSGWLNKYGLDTELPELLSSGDLDDPIQNGTSYDTVHYFYCYPNGTEEDSVTSTVWSPRYTRLVIEVEILGKGYYYPVSIPGIESNHTYDIKELKITRIGSSSPDVPVESGAFSIEISVSPWAPGSDTEVII